jgi:hypothetical protein
MPPRLGVGDCGTCTFYASIYAPELTLKLRKITVNPQSGHPKITQLMGAENDWFGRFGYRLAVASTGLLALVALGLHSGRRGQPYARVRICRVAKIRCSPRQLAFSGSSQLGL